MAIPSYAMLSAVFYRELAQNIKPAAPQFFNYCVMPQYAPVIKKTSYRQQ